MYPPGSHGDMNLSYTSSEAGPSQSDPEYIVVGAGLAGLAAAVTLHRAGREVVLLERDDSVGGRVRTDIESGFVLDRGFQVLLTTYPELGRHLDLASLNLRPFIRGANVWDAGRFVELAHPRSSFRGALNALRTGAFTPGDRFRLLKFGVRLGRSKHLLMTPADDCPTGELLERLGFSSHSMMTFWEPLLSGIQLTSSLEGSARLASLILRCLARGPAAVPAEGMQAIPRQMASNLPANVIRLRTEVEAIHGSKLLLTGGEELSARRVVIATEQRTAARLLREEPRSTRSQWHAYFGADEAPNDSRAIHLMAAGQGPCRNLAIMSNVAPEYAPHGKALIVVAGPTTDAEPPLTQVRQQLQSVFGSQTESWQLLKAGVVAEAQPTFVPGTPLVRQQQLGNFLIAGDHQATPSIQGALVSGRVAAHAAMAE